MRARESRVKLCAARMRNAILGNGLKESSVRKKMAALTTIPYEPNTAHKAHRKLCFCEIYPRTNNIVHAGFQGFRAFLCAFMSVFEVFVR